MNAVREQRSLFGEILDWMLAPLLLVWPMSVTLTWLVAQDIAGRPYDRELAQVAQVIVRQVRVEPRPAGQPMRLSDATAALLRSDDVDRVYYQILDTQGHLLAGDEALPRPRVGAPPPTADMQFRDEEMQNERVRVAYVLIPADGDADARPARIVQVAETLDKRARLANDIIKGVILPQFVILPVAVLLVWFALARGIAPLNHLQRRIRQRANHDLSPIDEVDAPEEVAPLVRSINDLLARLDNSMRTQKHFLTDAAHQLKTPLAGLRTQAELAQREFDSSGDVDSVRRSLRQISRSSQRATHMVNQLLSLARAEDKEHARRPHEYNLVRLATETVHDFVPRALEKQIDLGYEGPEPTDVVPRLVGQPLLVRELIRNLVDNALHYTPPGGTVTVRIVPGGEGRVVLLQVEDSGPGIPEAERELVFMPFYRVLGTQVDGSGLGLAIVREIAYQHGAEIVIEDAAVRSGLGGPGVRFTVIFPVRAAAVAPPPAD